MSICDENDIEILLAAKTWYSARLEYFSKEGKTIPEDLTPIANAEHNLMKAVRENIES